MRAQYIEAVSFETPTYPTVFLAGGITNCPDWQQKILGLLSDELISVVNPRRKNFPIEDPNAAQEQIEWEFHRLNQCDIFSMWFSDADSDQPICMYELGRHLVLHQDHPETIVIGVEPGYRRAQDVIIQSGLVDSSIPLRISNNLQDHAENIKEAVLQYVSKRLYE